MAHNRDEEIEHAAMLIKRNLAKDMILPKIRTDNGQ